MSQDMENSESATILIVEDDAGVAKLQRRQLERAGYQVVTAGTGAEALEHIRQGGLDLAVLDFRLPDEITGLDLYAQIKNAGNDLPVILVTGFSDEATAILALRAGVQDFVAKSMEYLDYLPEAVKRILAQARLKDALKKSEERFRLLARATTDGIWDWDILTGQTWRSESFQRLFGYDILEITPNCDGWPSPVDPEDVERVASSIRAALDGSDDSWSAEYRLRLRNGSVADVLARGYILRDSAGRALRMIGSVTDCTERKRFEAALREKEEQLRQSQKLEAVGQLAGGVAHEFNNLLHAVIGYVEIALQSLPAEHSARNDLREIERAVGRAISLTRQLLSFSRTDRLQRTQVDLNATITELMGMLRPLLDAGIDMQAEMAEGVGTVYADPGALQQILLNLCVNARDAMSAGGRLTVATETAEFDDKCPIIGPSLKPGRYVVLRISDTGSGMAPDVKERIFEPFFTTKDVGKGTGLGLSMVYGLVEQHQGAILVDSELGMGTTLRIYLPSSPEKTACVVPPEGTPAAGTETILFADDDSLIRDIGVRVLQKAGYTVLAAQDGEDAIQQFLEHKDAISLVLLDVAMPKLAGDEAYRRMRAIRLDVPVIISTGNHPDAARIESLRDDGIVVLQKPFTSKRLLQAVRDQLDANRSASGAS